MTDTNEGMVTGTDQQIQNNLGFRLETIEVLSHIFDESDLDPSQFAESRIGFLTKVRFNVQNDLARVFITTDITAVIQYKGIEEPEPFANLVVRTGFAVVGLEALVQDKKLPFPELFSHA